MNILPNELLAAIFELLDDAEIFVVGIVSKMFDRITRKVLKKRLNKIDPKILYKAHMMHMLSKFKNDLEIEIGCRELYHTKSITVMTNNIPEEINCLRNCKEVIIDNSSNYESFCSLPLSMPPKLKLHCCIIDICPKGVTSLWLDGYSSLEQTENLHEIRELTIYGNNNSIPSLFYFKSLEKICFISSGRTMNEFFRDKCILPKLKTILGKKNATEHFPENVGAVKKIDLSFNKIKILPNMIIAKKLEFLDLSHNLMREIPSIIGTMKNLKSLNFSNCKITKVTSDLALLKNLRSIDLSSNCLKAVPRVIAKIENLKKLFLANNEIKIMSKSLFKHKYLEEIYFDKNCEIRPDKKILNMISLKILSLVGCELCDFRSIETEVSIIM